MAKAKAKAAGSQKAGLERQADLTEFTGDNPWLVTFYAKHTFEVDFVAAGNHEAVVQTITAVYKDEETRKEAKQQLQSGDLSQMGTRTLTMAKQEGKGWFAHARRVPDSPSPDPSLYNAGHSFCSWHFSSSLSRILQHRAECRYGSDILNSQAKQAFLLVIERFVQRNIGLAELRREIGLMIPGDPINVFLAEMQ